MVGWLSKLLRKVAISELGIPNLEQKLKMEDHGELSFDDILKVLRESNAELQRLSDPTENAQEDKKNEVTIEDRVLAYRKMLSTRVLWMRRLLRINTKLGAKSAMMFGAYAEAE